MFFSVCANDPQIGVGGIFSAAWTWSTGGVMVSNVRPKGLGKGGHAGAVPIAFACGHVGATPIAGAGDGAVPNAS